MTLCKAVGMFIAGVVGLFLGIALFFPVDIAAEYTADSFAAAAAEKNIWLSYGDFKNSGIIDKNIICKKISADTAALSIRASEIKIDPLLLASLFSASKTAGIFVEKGDMATITGQKLKWSSASARIRAKGDSLSFSEIVVTGEISVRGYADISRSTGKIIKAAVTVRFPPELDPAAAMLSGMNFIPMTKISSGEWRIVK